MDKTGDAVTDQVIDILVSRQKAGQDEYGITLEEHTRPAAAWINETIEELLDAVQYLTKLKRDTISVEDALIEWEGITAGGPCVPSAIDDSSVMALRKAVQDEEWKEFNEALESKDLGRIIKEACDVVYVVVGTLVRLGLPFDKAFKIVHENNMSKCIDGKLHKRADGKVLKPDNYIKVDHKELEKLIKG